MYDLNSDKLLEKDGVFLEGAYTKLPVRIKSVKNVTDSQKPCAQVMYRVIKGEHTGKLLSAKYYLTEPSFWKLRLLACACGFYTLKENKNKELKKFVTDEFMEVGIKMCDGKDILIDTIVEEYEGRPITKVSRECEIINENKEAPTQIKETEYPSEEELKNMPDLEETTTLPDSGAPF